MLKKGLKMVFPFTLFLYSKIPLIFEKYSKMLANLAKKYTAAPRRQSPPERMNVYFNSVGKVLFGL